MKTNNSYLKTALIVAAIGLASCSSTKTAAKNTVNTIKNTTKQVVSKAFTDSVSFVNAPTSINNAPYLEFDIKYTAKSDREIVLTLNTINGNTWIAGTKIKVQKGSGLKKIRIQKPNGTQFDNGSDYNLFVAIRPLNTTWKETIEKVEIKPFTIK